MLLHCTDILNYPRILKLQDRKRSLLFCSNVLFGKRKNWQKYINCSLLTVGKTKKKRFNFFHSHMWFLSEGLKTKFNFIFCWQVSFHFIIVCMYVHVSFLIWIPKSNWTMALYFLFIRQWMRQCAWQEILLFLKTFCQFQSQTLESFKSFVC